MNNIENTDKFSKMIKKARIESGKSQEYVAKKMGVTKKTIQNWECGYSSPSVTMCMSFFDAIGLQPLPFFLQLLYGEFNDISPKSADKMIEHTLIERIKICSPQEKRKLLFLLYGDHGSSTHGILEMITAHLHVPLKDRLNVAQNVILNYEIAQKQGTVLNNEHVMPDIDFLKSAFDNAYSSVVENKTSYFCIKKE